MTGWQDPFQSPARCQHHGFRFQPSRCAECRRASGVPSSVALEERDRGILEKVVHARTGRVSFRMRRADPAEED